MFRINGFNYASFWNGKFVSEAADQSMTQLAATGANAVAIVATRYVADLGSTTIFDRDNTESLANVRHAVRDAIARGLEVNVKPHLDSATGQWRAWFNPADTAAWFASYKDSLLDYARIAASEGASALTIGTELVSMTGPEHRDAWLDIIQAVRRVFDGHLTYAATPEEAKHLGFWDALDSVGLNPYFQVAQPGQEPTVDSATRAWTEPAPTEGWWRDLFEGMSPIEWMASLARQHGKPVQLLEVGFRSVDGGGEDPGIHDTTGLIDPGEQAILYQGMFRALEQAGDWFDGLYLWNWEPVDTPSADYGYTGTSYTPQNLPAHQVVAQAFGGRVVSGQPVAITADQITQTAPGRGLLDSATLANGRQARVMAGDDALEGWAASEVAVRVRFAPGEGDQGRLTLQVNGLDAQTAVLEEGLATIAFHFAANFRVDRLNLRYRGEDGADGVTPALLVEAISINGTTLDPARGTMLTADKTLGAPVGVFTSFGDLGFAGSLVDDLTPDRPARRDPPDRDRGDDADGPGGRAPSARADSLLGHARRGDTIDAMGGNDRIAGRGGDDRLQGGAGHDRLDGGTGHDRLEGGVGNDLLHGRLGDDTLSGGAGRDRLLGALGSDRLSGDDGNDWLAGEAGRDVLYGGAGRDRLVGGTGNDVLTGGAGADLFVFARGSGVDTVVDFHSGHDDLDLRHSRLDSWADLRDALSFDGGAARLDLGGGSQVILLGLEPGDLGRGDVLL